MVSRPTFAERLAYALLLFYWRRGRELSQKALAEAVSRTGPTVAEWYDRAEPPKDWQVHAPMARVLDVPESWLIRGQGDPPRPHLWTEWLAERRAVAPSAAPVVNQPPVKDDLFVDVPHPSKRSTAGQAGAKKRRQA